MMMCFFCVCVCVCVGSSIVRWSLHSYNDACISAFVVFITPISSMRLICVFLQGQRRWRSVTIYSMGIGFMLLFLFSHYNNLCKMYCGREICMSDGICMLHLLMRASDADGATATQLQDDHDIPIVSDEFVGANREFEF